MFDSAASEAGRSSVTRSTVCAVVLVLCWTGLADAQHILRGTRLDDALKRLQSAGLAIVFSSQIVTPDMRVTVEPQGQTLRGQLNELLAPHGLKADDGPGGTLLVVRAPRTAAAHNRRSPLTSRPARPGRDESVVQGFADRVTVRPSDDDRHTQLAGEMTLDGDSLRTAESALAPDGAQVVLAMPGVVAVDDFRSDFSVRGSPYRQIGIVVDGVATRWLEHTLYGRKDASSLSMFATGILAGATLEPGAHPLREDETIGAQLSLSLREGSRTATHVSASAGGMTAAVEGEGPIGSAGNGSWIAGFRDSYGSWPPAGRSALDAGFAFADVHGKAVYDLTSTQQVSVTALGGQSLLDTMDEPDNGEFGTSTNQAALVTLGWRSTLSPRTTLIQRVFVVGQQLSSTSSTVQLGGRLRNQEVGYRTEVLHAVFSGLLNVGVEHTMLSAVREGDAPGDLAPGETFRRHWSTTAGFVSFERTIGRHASVEAGARASQSSLIEQAALSPWLVATWRLRDWSLHASASVAHQLPDVDAVRGAPGTVLLPERAVHLDVGFEQRLPRAALQVALFNRREDHVLRGPDFQASLVDRALDTPSATVTYRNALSGTSRGVDVVLRTRETKRLSGWASYTFAKTRQSDALTGESFWADFDHRHAFNASGVVDLGAHATAGLVVRADSGSPVVGYFAVDGNHLIVSPQRNEIRLPAYLRLDVRAQKTFFSSAHAVTMFAEAFNVLNSRGRGVAQSLMTTDAGGFAGELLPRRVSLGIRVDLTH